MACILRDEVHSMPTEDATSGWTLALNFWESLVGDMTNARGNPKGNECGAFDRARIVLCVLYVCF